MKKIITLILILALASLALISCGEDPAVIRIGYMTGPTGMGMAELIHNNGGIEGNEKYSFTKYDNTSLAMADIAAGKIDMVCVPTNDAATYYNNTSKDITVLAINTLSSLFVLTDANNEIKSFSDLEGKTVYTCKNGTPRIILEALIEKAGLENVTVSYMVDNKEIGTPKQLGEQLVAGNIDIAVVPEPIITSSLLTINKNNNPDISYTVDLPLSGVWAENFGAELTMGCIIASDSFVDAHPKLTKSFLEEYKSSINFVGNKANIDSAAEYVVEAGVMAAAPAAKKALGNLGNAISYMDGQNMKTALEAFYGAIGLALPDDEFYFNK